MQQSFIRVLVINESRDQYIGMVNVLQSVMSVDYELTWCADYSHALEALLSPLHDIILLDFEHNSATCHDLLRSAASHDCNTPIICLTSEIDEQLDCAVIKAGAADYLMKSEMSPEGLERAIRYAIDRKHSEIELARLAHYDLLTGIPNRALFNDRLDRALQRAQRGDAPFSLLYVDLDGFKAINDTYGHDKGDMLVQGIAQRLQQCIRRTDSVARVGGDEFTVLVEKVGSLNDTISIAQKIIDVIVEPFDLGHQHVRVGCSIGIAVYPDAGQDAQTLLRHADMAMYEAKGIAGSNYRFFTDKMNAEAVDQNRLEVELRGAINQDQLDLYFQPRISLRTGKVVAVEALLRWHHPERGLVLPGEFLDLAEQAGLLPQIGYWVLNRLCSDIGKMNAQNIPPLRVSLNVGASQFYAAGFVDGVKKIFANHQVNPRRFEFELAEPELLSNVDVLAAEMYLLAAEGVHFSLDDFGTGFSSVPQLQQLPIETVKLDGSHVQNATKSIDSAKVVKAMISLAHELSLQVVAEGVETEAQRDFMVENHCDQLQGNFYSPAIPFDDFLKLFVKKPNVSTPRHLSLVDTVV